MIIFLTNLCIDALSDWCCSKREGTGFVVLIQPFGCTSILCICCWFWSRTVQLCLTGNACAWTCVCRLPSGRGSAPDGTCTWLHPLVHCRAQASRIQRAYYIHLYLKRTRVVQYVANVDRYVVYQARESSVQTCTESCSHLCQVQKASCLILSLGQTVAVACSLQQAWVLRSKMIKNMCVLLKYKGNRKGDSKEQIQKIRNSWAS